MSSRGFLLTILEKITGVARDLLTDEVFEIRLSLVINTTGWSDSVPQSVQMTVKIFIVRQQEFTW